ncbi:MAG: DUF1822 family protein, partial [Microcystaceae cyanobacterium]
MMTTNLDKIFNYLERSLSPVAQEEQILTISLSPEEQENAWNSSDHPYSNSVSRWNAYLNKLSLNTVKKIFRDDDELGRQEIREYPQDQQVSFWDILNGSYLTVGSLRFLIIPSDTDQINDLEIAQEWIDIPSLVPHYYGFVNLDLEENLFYLLGFLTHKMLNQNATLQPNKRLYYLSQPHLLSLDSLVISQKRLSSNPISQNTTTHLQLSSKMAKSLIQQLSQTAHYSPKLDTSFRTWAALIENYQWREKLYQERLKEAQSTVLKIEHWLQRNFTLSIQLGWKPEPELVPIMIRSPKSQLEKQLANASSEQEVLESVKALSKIDIGNSLMIDSLINLIQQTNNEANRWYASLILGRVAPDHSYGAVSCYKLFDFSPYQLKLRVAVRCPCETELLPPSTILIFIQPEVIDEQEISVFEELQLKIIEPNQPSVIDLNWTALPIQLDAQV